MYSLNRKSATIKSIVKKEQDIQLLNILFNDQKESRAVNYIQLSGELSVGDRVIVNSTAVDLGLGTGGYHFVISKITATQNNNPVKNKDNGHIMKLRYTPFQMCTLSVEEEASPYHELIKNFTGLAGQVVVFIPLHSLLAPLVISFKKIFPQHKVAYIMSEGGSLALPFSNTIKELKRDDLLDKTITMGHAFGGDYEAVNIYTALACAKEVVEADLIVVGMGPGLVGTNTPLGFSGTENALYSYAVNVLEGRSIIVPRVTFAEKRKRHYILSHHTVTLLKNLMKHRTDVVFPRDKRVRDYLDQLQLGNFHNLNYYETEPIKDILENSNYSFSSMGRKLDDDPLFFITAGLAVLRYREMEKE